MEIYFLNSVTKEDYSVFPKKEHALDYKDVKPYLIHDIESYKIIFIDGKYSSHLSETTHDKIDVCILSSALAKAKYNDRVMSYFNKIANRDSLTSLNTAFSSEGAFIHIPKGTVVEKPIQIINFVTGHESALMLQPRNLIIVDDNAQLQVIERHQSLTDNAVLTNVVSEVFAGNNAVIDWYKIQNDKQNASLIDHTFIDQKRDSNCSVHTFSFGGKLVRNNLNFFQMELM